MHDGLQASWWDGPSSLLGAGQFPPWQFESRGTVPAGYAAFTFAAGASTARFTAAEERHDMRIPTTMQAPTTQTTRRPRQHGRPRRAGPIAIALVTVGLLAAACSHGSSGPGVAGAGSPAPSGQSSSSSGAHASALAYAQCMRTNGIADFPDPDSSGQIDIKGLHPGPGSDLDSSNSRFQAAAKACQSLQPIESAAQQRQDQAQTLKWARCMRAHGITKFPDPDSNGRIGVHSIISAGIDFNSPQVQAAAKACQKYQPGSIRVPGGAGGS
jgi:hypothetical protein